MIREDAKALGEALRAMRVQAGRSQEGLANALGVTRVKLANVESGYDTTLSVATIRRIGVVLSCDVAPLLLCRARHDAARLSRKWALRIEAQHAIAKILAAGAA